MVVPMLIRIGNSKIFDIRQHRDFLEASETIICGLSSTPPTLPEFLLWDDKGLELFDQFCQTASYYPFHSELEIFNRSASEIVANVPAGGAVIELGCGTTRKTEKLLSVFDRQQKQIHYFALDLSHNGLTDSITKLSEAFHESQNVEITGLLGTYEDCILWLQKLESLPRFPSITFLWLGNSIANFHHHSGASAFLARIKNACKLSHTECNFILSTDVCDEEMRINEAYSLEIPELQTWLKNGLIHANAELGGNFFQLADWKVIMEFDRQQRNLTTFYTALSDVRLKLKPKGSTVLLSKGTKIPIINSGKWNEATMEKLCFDAGFFVQQQWKDDSGNYCVYRVAASD